MGAVFLCEVVDGKLTEKELEKWFVDRVDECRDEYGSNAYNGTFSTLRGLRITQNVFNTQQEAYDYLDKNTEKWGSAVAVKFKDTRARFVKQPTFNGKAPNENGKLDYTAGLATHYVRWCGHFELRCLHAAVSGGTLVPADQLTDAQKTSLIKTYQDFREQERQYEARQLTLREIINKIQQPTGELTPEDYKQLKASLKARPKALARVEKAASKLKALDDKLAAKLFKTTTDDLGLQWLVGGVCAE